MRSISPVLTEDAKSPSGDCATSDPQSAAGKPQVYFQIDIEINYTDQIIQYTKQKF